MAHEMGKKLLAFDLAAGKVVLIKPPGKDVLITMWVDRVLPDEKVVAFYSGVMQWIVVNRFDDTGMIYDDEGREVRVFEYLGAI